MIRENNFAIYYAGDAYSTAQKIIGRQSAGKTELAEELGRIRVAARMQRAEPWPTRADPFARFAHFPTQTLGGNWQVRPQPDAAARLRDLLGLSMASYAFDAALLPKEALAALLTVLEKNPSPSVNELLTAAGLATPPGVRALMWLWKFDLIKVLPG